MVQLVAGYGIVILGKERFLQLPAGCFMVIRQIPEAFAGCQWRGQDFYAETWPDGKGKKKLTVTGC